MSKKQVEVYLGFAYKSNIFKKICKIIVTREGDIFMTLPYTQDKGPTFLVNMEFPLNKVYGSSGEKILSSTDMQYLDVSMTERMFKLSYHPDGFTQFSGQGQIVSGRHPGGLSKGFGHKAPSFYHICPGPFMGGGFQGNLDLFERASFQKGIINSFLPIYKRGITNKYIDKITYENNINLELFLRRIDETDPRLRGVVHLKEYSNELLATFPHPDEGSFQSNAFPFEHNGTTYFLLARLLVWDGNNNKITSENGKIVEDTKELRYSIGPATHISPKEGIGMKIDCYHGKYWHDIFHPQISRLIDLN